MVKTFFYLLLNQTFMAAFFAYVQRFSTAENWGGFKPNDAQDTVKGAAALLGPQASVEQLVRASLKKGA